MALVVEVDVGVDGLSVDAGFEMQVGCGGPACLSCEGDDLSGLHPVAGLDEVLAVVAVVGLQAVLVADADQVSVTGEGS